MLLGATGNAMVGLINTLPDPGEKCSAAMAFAFNAATSLAAMIMDGFDAKNNKLPNPDHNLLALLLINEGCTMSSAGDAIIEFSTHRLRDALDQFQKITGRSGESLLNVHLRQVMVENTKVDLSKFGPNSKFLQ
jgi:hypothetical protein